MAVKSSLWVESALVGLADLVNSIIVNLLCLLWAKQVAGSEASIGQPHEYAVEPHLICIDCLVPIYSLLGARLLVELLHESLHSLEILSLGVFLIHTGHEMARTNLIKIIVFQLICTNLAFVVDHRVGVKLAVFADVVATISKIGVEHGFEFYTHYIAPSWRLCEVEHIRLRHSLHLRIGQPLAIVLIWLLLQAKRTIDKEILVFHVAGLSSNLVTFLHTIEAAVLDVDVINVGNTVEGNDEHAVLTLIASDVLDVDVAHCRHETAAADFLGLIVEVDFQNRFAALSYLDVAGINVLNDTATASVGLDAYNAVEIGTVHLAVLGKQVAAAS